MARRFDAASDQKLERASNATFVSTSTAITMGGWFRPGPVAATHQFTRYMHLLRNGTQLAYAIIDSGSVPGQPRFQIDVGGAQTTPAVTALPSVDQTVWYFVAGRWESGQLLELRVYEDVSGTLTQIRSSASAAAVTGSMTLSVPDAFYIAGGPTANLVRAWTGDAARCFLSASYQSWAEIEDFARGQHAWTPSVGEWDLLGTASPEPDSTVNGNDLTVSGATALVGDDPPTFVTSQFARPTADAFVGSGWVDEGGAATNLFESLDETTASDADFVRSPTNPASSVYVCQLGSLTDPTSSSGHVLRYRYDKEGTSTIDLTVELRQGYTGEGAQGTLIASATHNDVTDAYVDGSLTLSAGEADAITNYGSLFVRFVAS